MSGRRGAGATDGELLARFVRSRDEDAVAALARRHAPMVWASVVASSTMVAAVAMVVLFAGTFAGLLLGRSQGEPVGARRSPRWQVADLSLAAVVVAVLVLALYA
jgi:hypothetical protein